MKSVWLVVSAVAVLVVGVPRPCDGNANSSAAAVDELVGLLQSQLGEAREQNALSEGRLEGLRQQLAESRAAYQNLAEALVTRDERILALEAKINAAGGQNVEDLIAARDRLEDENTLLQGRIQDQQRRLTALEVEHAALVAAAEAPAARIADLEQELRDLQGAVALATDTGDHARQIEELTATLTDLRARKQGIEDENAMLKGRIADIQASLAQVEESRNAAQADLRTLRESDKTAPKVAALERELADLRSVEAQRKETMDDLFRQLSEVRRERDAGLRKGDLIEAERDSVMQEMDLVRQELKALEEEVVRLRGEREAARAAVTSERDVHDAVAIRLAETAAELERVREASRALQDQLHTQSATDEQRRRAMDELLTRLAGMEAETARVRELKAEALQARDAARESSAELQRSLDRELKARNEAVQQLELGLREALEARDAQAATVEQLNVDIQRLTQHMRERDAALARVDELERAQRERDALHKDTLDDLFRQLAALRRERDAGRQDIESLQAALNQAREAADLAHGKVAAAQDMQQQTRRELADLQSVLEAERESIATRLASERADLEAALVAERKARQELADALTAKDGAVARAAADHAALQAEMAQLSRTDEQRRRAMDELLTRLGGLETALEQGREALAIAHAERDTARDESAKLSRELERTLSMQEQSVTRLQQDLKSALEARDELAVSVGRYEVESGRLTAQVNELNTEINRLRALDAQRKQSMDTILLERAKIEEELEQSRNLLAGIRRERDEAVNVGATLRSELDRERDAQSQTVTRLEQDLKAALEARDELAAAISRHEVESGRLTAMVAELDAEIKRLRALDAQRRESMDQVMLESARVKEDLGQTQTQLAGARRELETAAQEIEGLRGTLDRERASRSQTVAALQDELETAVAARDTLAADIGQHEVTAARLTAKVEELGNELARLRTIDTQRKARMDTLLEDYGRVESELEQTSRVLVGVRRERDSAIESRDDLAARLEQERGLREQSIARFEQEIDAVAKARDELAATTGSQAAEVARLQGQVEELGGEIARLLTIDAQRRISMDNLMLEVAKEQNRSRVLAAELESIKAAREGAQPGVDQSVVDLLKAQVRDLERANRDLRLAVEQAVPAHADPGAAAADAAPRVAQLMDEAGRLRADREALQRRVQALEVELAAQSERAAEPPDEVSAAIREEWERERAELNARVKQLSVQRENDEEALAAFRESVDQLRAENTRMRSDIETLQRVKAQIERDSDLFRKVEQSNIELREKVAEAEAGRARAEQALDDVDRRATELGNRLGETERAVATLERDLTEARERGIEKNALIETFMGQVPEMEQLIATLESERLELRKTLAERNNALDTLRVELDNREHRLVKAERVVEVLESAREQVARSADRERRDMHYNMAGVYARDGRFRDAEAEYLRALEIDPADADVHYNLGILYDDDLNSPDKAMRHYRRYLRLRPHGEDADAVRHWLRQIEMRSSP